MASFDDYLTVQSAAEILKIHPESVRRLIRHGELPARKWGNQWLVSAAAVDTFSLDYDGRRGPRPRPGVVKARREQASRLSRAIAAIRTRGLA